MNTLEILKRAGYEAVSHPTIEGAAIVQDAVRGYNSGKYAVDSFNAVTVREKDVFKFIIARS